VRNAPQVLSVLSSEDIARTGEGDIAGALQRVTGSAWSAAGWSMCAGLGDRYSLSLLNGSPLPEPRAAAPRGAARHLPDQHRRLGLVQKSFSPNFPASSAAASSTSPPSPRRANPS
jgi:hypothetical protein